MNEFGPALLRPALLRPALLRDAAGGGIGRTWMAHSRLWQAIPKALEFYGQRRYSHPWRGHCESAREPTRFRRSAGQWFMAPESCWRVTVERYSNVGTGAMLSRGWWIPYRGSSGIYRIGGLAGQWFMAPESRWRITVKRHSDINTGTMLSCGWRLVLAGYGRSVRAIRARIQHRIAMEWRGIRSAGFAMGISKERG